MTNEFWFERGRLTPVPGTKLETACHQALEILKQFGGDSFEFYFNGIRLVATAHTSVASLVKQWSKSAYSSLHP